MIPNPSRKLTSRTYGRDFEICPAHTQPVAALDNRKWPDKVDTWHPETEASDQCRASGKHGHMEAGDKPIERQGHPSTRYSYLEAYLGLFRKRSQEHQRIHLDIKSRKAPTSYAVSKPKITRHLGVQELFRCQASRLRWRWHMYVVASHSMTS